MVTFTVLGKFVGRPTDTYGRTAIRRRQFDTDNSTPTFVAENIISIIIIVCIIILNVLDV